MPLNTSFTIVIEAKLNEIESESGKMGAEGIILANPCNARFLKGLTHREGVNNPSHGNCPLGGYPPPPGAITDNIFPKS